ncbi:23967_t:CDS:2, partial [Racocetra persica]
MFFEREKIKNGRTEKNEVIDLTIGDEDVAKPSCITEDEKIIETARSMVPEIYDDMLM